MNSAGIPENSKRYPPKRDVHNNGLGDSEHSSPISIPPTIASI